MTRFFCILLYLCPILIRAQNNPILPITGKVFTIDKQALPGTTLQFKKSKAAFLSTTDGSFNISGITLPDTLIVSHIGYLTKQVVINNSGLSLSIFLEANNGILNEVTVNTGYQSVPKERSTGSFVLIDKELINRKVSTNILDRLDGVTSGLIFNRNKTPGANESEIVIRGRSTIFGQVNPLIVVDNFPYDGDINNINPNEVESITVLKDAAASSIWGVRSGNGVIVITTKKGNAGQAPKVSFNTNLTIGSKPDLFYQPLLDAKDYIDVESFLFAKGYYNSRINSPYLSISPAVAIMAARRNSTISAADSATQMNALANNDVRSDLLSYFYRPSVSQQYALSISGGGNSNQYFLFAGYDKTLGNQQGYDQGRVNLTAKNTLQIIPNKLELSTNIAFTSSTADIAPAAFNNAYPIYQKLVDANGNALPVYSNYKKTWLDTIGQGQLLDWTLRPYDELRFSNNHTRVTDYRIAATLKYKIISKLDLTLLYQYEDGRSTQDNFQTQNTYATRDLINRFTQPDYTLKNPVRQVPLGTLDDNTLSSYNSNNARALLGYNTIVGEDGKLTVLAGTEVKDYQSFTSAKRLYGYNVDNATDIAISPITSYPTLPIGALTLISGARSQSGTADRYLSYFGNAGYTYRKRYLFNASARKDESNLFGVNANQKGVPLWSAGLGWITSNEKWFHSSALSYLKIRTTFGYNGNVDKSTSAYTTGGVGLSSFFTQPTVSIINPPNPDLSWEKTSLINLGADFALFQGTLSGSLEGYYRKGTNLTGLSQVAAQTGVTQFRQNIADISGRGIDLSLFARPIHDQFTWDINFLYSYNTDRIDRYLLAPSAVKLYVTGISSNPMEGKSWSAVYAYKWNGLSPSTGDPQGYVGGATSTDFSKLISPATTADISYMGNGRPTHFGSLRNTFSYRHISLSCNIMYELGYYYRRSSVSYASMFSGSLAYGNMNLTNADVAKRWQKPGDELVTNVPSMLYPGNASRDEFYNYSETLVEKGDHIRLRDIQLSYDLSFTNQKNNPVKNAKVYLYANNIGILWRANKSHTDPDAVTGLPAPLTISAGVNIDFK